MGRRPADRVLRGGTVVNVHTAELQRADVAIAEGRIALVGDATHTIGQATEVIELDGMFLVPGLIDTHAHSESTLVTVGPFAEAALAAGTTTTLIENHDTANVYGVAGVEWMLAEVAEQRAKVILAVPACVPPMRSLEDSAATLDPSDVRDLLENERVGALGEMMNMIGTIGGDPRMLRMIGDTLDKGLIATGHWSLSGWNDHRLQAYAATGVDSCHESVSPEDALAKLRAGMWVQFREGSAFHDMAALAPILTERLVDPRHIMFVTDDVDPEFLIREGHLDNAVRIAIQHGVDPISAIQCVTLAPAEYLGRRHDIGSIAPGRAADIVIVDDLAEFRPSRVFLDGEEIDRAAARRTAGGIHHYPPIARESVTVGAVAVEELAINAPMAGSVDARIIGLVNREVPTEHRIVRVPTTNGHIVPSVELDIAKLVLITRHGGPRQTTLGLLQGLTLTRGALAQSTARDTHHLLAVGMNDDDIVTAITEVERIGGGIVLVDEGKVTASLRLPIAGLVSDQPLTDVAADFRALGIALADLGCAIEHPTTMLALLAVSAIPELRIGNRGLIDSRAFELVDVIADHQRESV
jgi:adenine deaminase